MVAGQRLHRPGMNALPLLYAQTAPVHSGPVRLQLEMRPAAGQYLINPPKNATLAGLTYSGTARPAPVTGWLFCPTTTGPRGQGFAHQASWPSPAICTVVVGSAFQRRSITEGLSSARTDPSDLCYWLPLFSYLPLAPFSG